MELQAEAFDKNKDHVNANKLRGNVRVYNITLSHIEEFRPGVKVSDFNYRLLTEFRDYKLAKSNTKSIVSHYLRMLRVLTIKR